MIGSIEPFDEEYSDQDAIWNDFMAASDDGCNIAYEMRRCPECDMLIEQFVLRLYWLGNEMDGPTYITTANPRTNQVNQWTFCDSDGWNEQCPYCELERDLE